jgi:hypothetical protein
LPPGPQPQGNIGYLAATSEGVFASSGNARQLFRFDPAGPAEVWPLSPDEAFIWVLRDRRDPAGGQMVQLTAAGLVPLLPRSADDISRRGPRFGLFACRLEADGTWHLRTARGPAHTRGLGHPLTFTPATAGHSFTDDPGTAAVFLSDGRSVYATERAGLLVVDVSGEIVQRLDRSHGLPAARIESLAVDADDGLWVALSDGIARVDFGSPLARHHAPHGITATPRRFASFERQLYLAHGQGLSRRDETTGIFSPVPGFVTTTNGLAEVGGRFVATARGLREVLPATGSRSWLPDDFGPVVAHPRRAGALFAGTPTGLALLTPDRRGGWRVTERSTAIDQAVDELHVTDGVLWAAGRLGALYRIELGGSGRLDDSTRRFTPADGWPGNRLRTPPQFFTFDGGLYVAGTSGLRRYDPSAHHFSFESRLAALGLPAAAGVDAAAVSPDGKLWLLFAPPDRQLVEVSVAPGGRWKASAVPGTRGALLTTPVSGLFAQPDARTLWILSRDALLSLDLAHRPAAPPPTPRVYVRRITALPDGAVLFDGAGPPPQLHLASAQRSLRFNFATPDFSADPAGQNQNRYRTRLDGVDDDWSAWSPAASREFTSLPSGELQFHVQARSPAGHETAVATLRLFRSAPWWDTVWARAAYTLLGLAAIAGLVAQRTLAARRRADRLEAIVVARTEELRTQNAKLARLRQIDRDESVAAKLAEEKTRLEMLRYQLNPHFLYNALNSIRALIFSRPPAAGDMVSQLADLCRVTLTRNEDLAPVSEEFAMLKLYLDMEQTRWRDKLAVEIDLTPDAAPLLIPPFLLLPLVENALKHGWQPEVRTLRLRLSARLESPATLVLAVANTGRWLALGESAAPSTGIGLENLRQRLRRYYPDTHTFVIAQEGAQVIANLRLTQPQLAAEPPRSV